MGPETRNAILAVGLVFWAFFALLTITVLIDDGIDILSITSIVILALLAPPLFSSLRGPPK